MPRNFYIGLFVLIIFLIILRFISLDIDPPLFFEGYTQAHLTDPYHLTFFARNATLFENWNPFDFHRWDVFKFSLISGFSYIIFSIAGVSRTTANLSAILLSLAGIGLFISGFYRLRSNREILITAGLLLLSSMLFFYGRLPFLENGLIFISGLLFAVFIKFHDRWWGQLISGFLIGLAALGGKLFGLIFLGPVILCLIYRYRTKTLKHTLRVLLGCIICIVPYILIFYKGNFDIIRMYYLERAVGALGSNIGVISPLTILTKLLTFGGGVGFFELSPFYISLAGLSLILLFLLRIPYESFRIESLPIIFSIGWLLCGVLGLMPFNYRPLRYALFLFLPMSFLGAYSINLLSEKKIKIFLSNKIITVTIIFFIFWYIFTLIPIAFGPPHEANAVGKAALPYTFLIALLVVTPLYFWLKNSPRIISRKLLLIIMLPLVAGLVINQGLLLFRGMNEPGKYLEKYGAELRQLVHKSAVVTGPYAPAMTIDNNIRGIIYSFGFSNVEFDLFDKLPITHIATDITNWDQALVDFPYLNQSTELAKYIVLDFSGLFFRLKNANVPLTDYEHGKILLDNNRADSALKYFEQFNREYPENLFGSFALAKSYKAAGRLNQCYGLMKELIENYSENYRVHIFCFNMFAELYRETKEKNFENLAAHHYYRAHELNPTLD